MTHWEVGIKMTEGLGTTGVHLDGTGGSCHTGQRDGSRKFRQSYKCFLEFDYNHL